jgi:DNA polymerase III alpha subunit
VSASFVHLHCHSEYSILDGACRIKELVKRAAELEMPAVTVTDHGSMAGTIELYKAAQKTGVKPIVGCEVYVVEDRFQREQGRERSWAHLTLLARDTEGYHNLVKLVTSGYLDGYHYKPRVDFDLMGRYAKGLIALSGCLSGRVCNALLNGNEEKARAELDRLVQIYGRENVYLELQDAGIAAHRAVNPGLIRLADETGIPLVGTGDVHYLRAEDADPHEALLCIQTGDELANPKRFRFENKSFYFKTPEEMARDFAPYGRELLRPTLEIAERCNVEIDLGQIRLPRFDLPEGQDALTHLTALCERGLAERYGTVDESLRARLTFELQTIREMGFADYFLIVWDFVDFAKRNGIGVGPGRGSAAGSLVAYCLRITDVDPIRYELLFERFLNPGRKSMPDIDIDFSVEGRERVLNYVVAKYGRERVAQIITFGKLAAKAATRDTGRVLGLPFGTVDRIAKMIPEGVKVGFDDCMRPGQELQAAYLDPTPIGHDHEGKPVTVRQLIDMARPLEGLVRQDSIHAAAVVIGDRDLSEYLPLQRKGADEAIVTQYPMGDVEALGLLKMDFLGLRNLDVIDEAVRLVRASRGVEIHIDSLPLDDEPTYEMLRRGDATGIFQFESAGMRDALRQVKPTEFEDLVALVALYRPGPMQNIPVYARRKNGQEPVTYTDPRLSEVLHRTYGVCVSQDALVADARTGERVRIGDLADGRDFVVQGIDDDWAEATGRVTRFIDSGERDVLELRTRSGSTLRLTADHLVLTESGWTPAGDLRAGDFVGSPRYLAGPDDYLRPPADVRRARILGASVTAVRSEPEVVPERVFMLGADGVAEFLATLWDCDGHVEPGSASLKTTSRSFARDVRDLLLRLGLRASVDRSPDESAGVSPYAYHVTVFDTRRFAELVQHRMVTAKREVGCHGRRFGIDHQHLERRGRAIPRIAASTASRVAEAVALPTTDRLLNVAWDEVVAIDPAGRERVCDITVEGIHSFVADGVVVHNCLYQEQSMQIAKLLGGFSPAEADDLRKAIGKKDAVLMASLKPKFIEGCAHNGVDAAAADNLWSENERSADYSFNKSHAACYALISYRTAYLKANYPAEYMAALISSVMDTKDKVPFYVAECTEMGIEVLPPDVSTSQRDFAVVEGRIRFGLSAVKNVGETAVRSIIDARNEGGSFVSIFDFCERVDMQAVSTRVLESLIRAGAFDTTGAPRKGLLEVVEGAVSMGRKSQADRLAGQGSIFDLDPIDVSPVRQSYPVIPDIEFDRRDLLIAERDTLGLYVSSHPLADVRDQLRRKVDCGLREIAARREGERVTIGGLVSSVRQLITKKGDTMAFVVLEDLTGSTEVTVFARTYAASRDLLVPDRIIVIRGRADGRGGGEMKLVADEVLPFDAVPETGVVCLAIDARRVARTAIDDLKSLVREFPGDHVVVVDLATSRGLKRLRLGPGYKVRPESAFFAEVRARLGEVTLA